MGAGKVDFKNLWQQKQERERRIRWRTLKSRHSGAVVSIYGYACQPPEGPWFGYTMQNLVDAPCTHCGQKGVFRPESWIHECAGIHQGKRLPCSEGIPLTQASHPCRGEPSMTYSGPAYSPTDQYTPAHENVGPSLWRLTDWYEVEIVSR